MGASRKPPKHPDLLEEAWDVARSIRAYGRYGGNESDGLNALLRRCREFTPHDCGDALKKGLAVYDDAVTFVNSWSNAPQPPRSTKPTKPPREPVSILSSKADKETVAELRLLFERIRCRHLGITARLAEIAVSWAIFWYHEK